MKVRAYQRLPHNHTHYCPSCQLELSLQQIHSTPDIYEFQCENSVCPVVFCYCNGSLSNYSLQFSELLYCADDILNQLQRDPTEVFEESVDSISTFGARVRSAIDENKSEVSVEDQLKAEQKFETFAKIERTLSRKFSTNNTNSKPHLQYKETGEPVLEFNGVYIPYSEVLVYTVLAKEIDSPRIIRFPTEHAQYLSSTDTEPYQLNLQEQLTKYYDGSQR